MSKKILFIMDSFPLGGISKSLLALLNELDDQYEIDLLLMKKEGLFVPLIPKNVNLLAEPIETVFRNPHPKYICKAFSKLSFSKFLKWCSYSMSTAFARCTGGLYKQIHTIDVYIGKNANKIDKYYDAAVAYQGGRCIYYLAEKIDSKVKIGYVHNDYSASEVDYMMKDIDKIYFKKIDYLVTISEKCVLSLIKEFPELSEKCKVIENICSKKMIYNMANAGETFNDGFNGIKLLTMGRFDINQKGIDYAISACKSLKEKNINFRWYFLGEGNEHSKIEKMIADNKVEDTFILLGAKINPYPYIKDCDIYVQPSRFEGKSVALDEVKMLQKPIVVTNFSTVNDQFENNKNALICEINSNSIVEKIEELIFNLKMRDKLSENLSNEKVGNEEQAEIFKELIGVK